MIHFNISIWRKGCVNENKLEFIVKERKLGSNEARNTRTLQHGGPVGSWRRRKTNWRVLCTHDILQSFLFTWFTNVYLIFPGFCPQGFSLPNLEQNLSVVAALNRSLTSASHLKKHLRKVNVISEICLKFSLNTLEYRYIKVCMQCGWKSYW